MNPSTSIEVEQNLCVIYLSYVVKSLSCRELLDSMQSGTLDPEVAFLNASLVLFHTLTIPFFLFFLQCCILFAEILLVDFL